MKVKTFSCGGYIKGVFLWIKDELLLVLFASLFGILCVLFPDIALTAHRDLDWKTIATLTALLIITTGVMDSQYFGYLTDKAIRRVKTERELAICVVLVSFLLAPILTNDVALFIVVPITIGLERLLNKDLTKLVILEAIAVNAGSSLTPIGNPQNIYIWHRWDIDFGIFVLYLLPLVLVSFLVLMGFVYFLVPNRTVKVESRQIINYRIWEFVCSLIALVVFIILLELDISYLLGLILVVGIYLVLWRRVLILVDWLLIVMFIFVFIDFHIVSELSVVKDLILRVDDFSFAGVYFWGAGVSQLISNVPSAIVVSKFSDNWIGLAYGVNVGGNGLLWSSFANIIALRFLRKGYIKFHLYSIPYLLIVGSLVYVLILLLFSG